MIDRAEDVIVKTNLQDSSGGVAGSDFRLKRQRVVGWAGNEERCDRDHQHCSCGSKRERNPAKAKTAASPEIGADAFTERGWRVFLHHRAFQQSLESRAIFQQPRAGLARLEMR
jgi:hypothetical protein